jgi:hypothetical protein
VAKIAAQVLVALERVERFRGATDILISTDYETNGVYLWKCSGVISRSARNCSKLLSLRNLMVVRPAGFEPAAFSSGD